MARKIRPLGKRYGAVRVNTFLHTKKAGHSWLGGKQRPIKRHKRRH